MKNAAVNTITKLKEEISELKEEVKREVSFGNEAIDDWYKKSGDLENKLNNAKKQIRVYQKKARRRRIDYKNYIGVWSMLEMKMNNMLT